MLFYFIPAWSFRRFIFKTLTNEILRIVIKINRKHRIILKDFIHDPKPISIFISERRAPIDDFKQKYPKCPNITFHSISWVIRKFVCLYHFWSNIFWSSPQCASQLIFTRELLSKAKISDFKMPIL